MHPRSRTLGWMVCALGLPSTACAPNDGTQERDVEGAQLPIIVGLDDRVNLENLAGDPLLGSASDGIATVGRRADLCVFNAAQDYCILKLQAPRTTTTILLETDGTWLYGGLCGDQLYSDEPLLDPGAGATAFWVGKDVFVTAGHVVKANTDPTTNSGIACKDVQVVFDYDIASFNTTTGTPDVAVIKKKQNTVYDCVDVLGNVKLPQGDPKLGHNEWTVFRVDRVVTGHHPLRVLPSGQPSVNEPVAIIGHGLGLPKKFDDGAFVKSVSATSGELTFSGDVFPGNSGGPIISLTTGYVVGMVAGNPPFQALTPGTDTWGTCYRYKPGCSTSSGCPGFPTGPLLNQSSIKSLLPTQQTGLYGDFDFDGQLDSVAVEPNAFGTLNVKVTSSSAGTFYFPTFIPASFGSLSALQVGDFNQDQYFDIIAHVNGLDPVYIDGGATLGLNISNSPYLAFQGFKSVVVRDINSDSAEDLVAVRDDGSRQTFLGGPSLAGTAGGLSPIIQIPPECGTGFAAVQDNALTCGNTQCFNSLTDYRSTRAVAVVPGSLVGVSDAPTVLAIDCPGGPPGPTQKSQILLIDPRDGSTRGKIPLSGGKNWRAFSYRAGKQDLIALESSNLSSDPFVVDQIAITGASKGTVTKLFADTVGGAQIATGLAWDGTDMRVLQDPNSGGSNVTIARYHENGVLAGNVIANFTNGCPAPQQWAPPHTAGLLVNGSSAAVVCNSNGFGIGAFNANTTILPVTPTGEVAPKPFFDSMMLHDIECDPVTFQSELKTVIWGVARGGRALRAFDISAGACGFGGKAPSGSAYWAGFEDPTKTWTSPDGAVALDSTTFTDGTHSLSVNGVLPRFRVYSPIFATSEWLAVGSQLTVDVLVPPGDWNAVAGHVKVVLSIPSAGLSNVHLGTVLLKDMVPGAWHPVSVPVSPTALSALLESHQDAQLLLDIHPQTPGSILLDRVRFTGVMTLRSDTP